MNKEKYYVYDGDENDLHEFTTKAEVEAWIKEDLEARDYCVENQKDDVKIIIGKEISFDLAVNIEIKE